MIGFGVTTMVLKVARKMPNDATPFTNSQIVAAFEQRTQKSKARHLEAREVFPSGIVHDSRHMKPHPLYI